MCPFWRVGVEKVRLMNQVIISHKIEETIVALENLKSDERFIKIIKEEAFLVEDVKLVMEKAYLTSQNTTVIILGAGSFSPVIQNRLLKILEEPPKNKIFILITPHKSTILPTIRSRLPIIVLAETKEEEPLELDMENLSLGLVYDFTQKHKRTNTNTMKTVIEQIVKEALSSQKYDFDEKTLTLCSNSYKALDMGSVPPFILNTLLLRLLKQKR